MFNCFVKLLLVEICEAGDWILIRGHVWHYEESLRNHDIILEQRKSDRDEKESNVVLWNFTEFE